MNLAQINRISINILNRAIADEIFKTNPFLEWLNREPLRECRRIAKVEGYTWGSNFEKM